jgi:putative transposase
LTIPALTGDLARATREHALDELEGRPGDIYPIVIKSWQKKWDSLSAYFKCRRDTRRVIYATSSIEALQRQFRKLTKTKGGFPNEDSLLKLLYLAFKRQQAMDLPIQSWNITLSQLALFFEGRLEAVLYLSSDD